MVLTVVSGLLQRKLTNCPLVKLLKIALLYTLNFFSESYFLGDPVRRGTSVVDLRWLTVHGAR